MSAFCLASADLGCVAAIPCSCHSTVQASVGRKGCEKQRSRAPVNRVGWLASAGPRRAGPPIIPEEELAIRFKSHLGRVDQDEPTWDVRGDVLLFTDDGSRWKDAVIEEYRRAKMWHINKGEFDWRNGYGSGVDDCDRDSDGGVGGGGGGCGWRQCSLRSTGCFLCWPALTVTRHVAARLLSTLKYSTVQSCAAQRKHLTRWSTCALHEMNRCWNECQPCCLVFLGVSSGWAFCDTSGTILVVVSSCLSSLLLH